MKLAVEVRGGHSSAPMAAAMAKALDRDLHLSDPNSRGAAEQRLIAFDVVRKLTGLSRSTIWRLERQGLFPQRRQISHRRVAWVSLEVLGWTQARTDDERVSGDRQ